MELAIKQYSDELIKKKDNGRVKIITDMPGFYQYSFS